MKKISDKKLPKIPKRYYRLDLNIFLKRIKRYPLEVQRRLLERRRLSIMLRRRWDEHERRGIMLNAHKLSELQKMQVIELAAKLYQPKQIIRIIREKFGVPDYTGAALNALLRNHKEVILQKRRAYLDNIDTLRLVHEKARIEELTDVFLEAKDDRDKRLQIEALKEIRQEVKGDKLTVDANLSGQINVDVKEALYKNVDIQSLVRLALLRVAERHNIEFDKIADRLRITTDVRDPATGVKLAGKQLPVKVGSSYYPEEKDIKRKKIEEEHDAGDDPEDLKRRLIAKLKQKIRENKKAQEEIEEVTEEEKYKKKRKKHAEE